MWGAGVTLYTPSKGTEDIEKFENTKIEDPLFLLTTPNTPLKNDCASTTSKKSVVAGINHIQ
jgi:hypothetical protein